MRPLQYENRALLCDGVALADIAAEVGTPCYVYSAATIVSNFWAYDAALSGMDHTIYYAMKANSNLAVLGLLAREGAGFDIVSGGELFRALKAGADPDKIVFSGVGKTAAEVDAALEAGIFAFNCESEPELALIDSLAGRLGKKARVAIRVNPDITASTHKYISTGGKAHKFGIAYDEAEAVYERARALRNLRMEGVSCHIGSQLDAPPVLRAVDKVLELIERLRSRGMEIHHADLGGGLGVAYKPEDVEPEIGEFVAELRKKTEGRGFRVMVEPGRSIVGNAGVLLTRVLYRKQSSGKEFVVADAAMTDLIRPALYQAHHEILPVRVNDAAPEIVADIVGPVCESGDFLAHDRRMADVFPGDLLAICTAGAYGFVQSSNYNSRPRAAEVMVENGRARVVRQRETYQDLIRGEG